MPQVTPPLPNNGDTAYAEDISVPFLMLLAIFNGHIGPDNIEPGSMPWSIMDNINNSIPATALQDEANTKKYRDEANIGFVADGVVVSSLTGLDGAITAGVIYTPDGGRSTVDAVTSHTFTASKDTYVDVGPGGDVGYSEVANDATPPALSSNYLRVARVRTSASAITSVADTRTLSPVSPSNNFIKNAFRAIRSSDQTGVTQESFTKVLFNSETYDTNDNYTPSNGRFVAPEKGLYHFDWSIYSGSSTALLTAIYVNGSAYSRGSWGSRSGVNLSTGSDDIILNPGDYVEIFGFISGGTIFGNYYTKFSGHMIGAVQ